MYDYQGKSALVTGAGSGIGKQLAIELATRGCSVTVADVQAEGVAEVAEEIRRHGGIAESSQCDVTDDQAQAKMFSQHVQRFGDLHIVVLNAGVGEVAGRFLQQDRGWQKILDINLRAVIVGAQLAVQHMVSKRTQGIILTNASAGGLFPMPYAPVYAASKAGTAALMTVTQHNYPAGVVNFTRSLSQPLGKQGIRLCSVCPQPVDTPLAQNMISAEAAQEFRTDAAKLLTVDQVVSAFIYLIEDTKRNGTVLLLHGVLGKVFEWQQPRGNLKPVNVPGMSGLLPEAQLRSLQELAHWATTGVPQHYRSVQVHRLSTDFREATRITQQPLQLTAPKGSVLMRRVWAGVNASDINYTAGRYFGSVQESERRLPFYAGFEAVGVVAAVGQGVTGLQVGQPIAEMGYGCFSEWGIVAAASAIPVAQLAPEVIALLTSGLTASIGLAEAGRMGTGETVLVTSAAGGTGQFVVQLAKAAGNTVVATCGSADKAALLRRLGADRVINYRSEDVSAVLRKEYPKGVDLVWETVGGDMLQACLRNLAVKGRLVVIGMMSQYASGWKPSSLRGVPELLLAKSATMTGFFYPHHFRHLKAHLRRLMEAWSSGRLHVSVDPTRFVGIESVPEAVDHLQAGHSIGKVVVQLTSELPPQQPAAKL